MKIPISHLREGHHSIELTGQPVDFGLEEYGAYSQPVKIRIDLEKRGGSYYLHYLISTLGTFACDRCLEPFEQTLEPDYYAVYSSTAGVPEEDDEDHHHLEANAIEIDITEDVRETILLAVPLKLLCRPDCKGLCPQCGANLNEEICTCPSPATDPRWEQLKQFKF